MEVASTVVGVGEGPGAMAVGKTVLGCQCSSSTELPTEIGLPTETDLWARPDDGMAPTAHGGLCTSGLTAILGCEVYSPAGSVHVWRSASLVA